MYSKCILFLFYFNYKMYNIHYCIIVFLTYINTYSIKKVNNYFACRILVRFKHTFLYIIKYIRAQYNDFTKV